MAASALRNRCEYASSPTMVPPSPEEGNFIGSSACAMPSSRGGPVMVSIGLPPRLVECDTHNRKQLLFISIRSRYAMNSFRAGRAAVVTPPNRTRPTASHRGPWTESSLSIEASVRSAPCPHPQTTPLRLQSLNRLNQGTEPPLQSPPAAPSRREESWR